MFSWRMKGTTASSIITCLGSRHHRLIITSSKFDGITDGVYWPSFFFNFFCLFWIVLESFRILLYKLQKIVNKVIHLRWAYTNKKCKQWTNKSLRNKAMPLYYHCQSHERYIQEERNVTFYFVFSITYTLVSVN